MDNKKCICRSEIDTSCTPVVSIIDDGKPVLRTGLLSTTPGSGPGQQYKEMYEQILEESKRMAWNYDGLTAAWTRLVLNGYIKEDDMKLITMSEYRAIRPKEMKFYFVSTDLNRKQLYRVYIYNKPIFEFDVKGNISVAFPKIFPSLLV